jgi:hypothetical protein
MPTVAFGSELSNAGFGHCPVMAGLRVVEKGERSFAGVYISPVLALMWLVGHSSNNDVDIFCFLPSSAARLVLR